MNQPIDSTERGRQDAKTFIANERIDYQPFVAISDLHLVRKTIPISYMGFQETVAGLDRDLWLEIDAAASRYAERYGSVFNFDHYAAGFAAGVAAVWETIRDTVLKEKTD